MKETYWEMGRVVHSIKKKKTGPKSVSMIHWKYWVTALGGRDCAKITGGLTKLFLAESCCKNVECHRIFVEYLRPTIKPCIM